MTTRRTRRGGRNRRSICGICRLRIVRDPGDAGSWHHPRGATPEDNHPATPQERPGD